MIKPPAMTITPPMPPSIRIKFMLLGHPLSEAFPCSFGQSSSQSNTPSPSTSVSHPCASTLLHRLFRQRSLQSSTESLSESMKGQSLPQSIPYSPQSCNPLLQCPCPSQGSNPQVSELASSNRSSSQSPSTHLWDHRSNPLQTSRHTILVQGS